MFTMLLPIVGHFRDVLVAGGLARRLSAYLIFSQKFAVVSELKYVCLFMYSPSLASSILPRGIHRETLLSAEYPVPAGKTKKRYQ